MGGDHAGPARYSGSVSKMRTGRYVLGGRFPGARSMVSRMDHGGSRDLLDGARLSGQFWQPQPGAALGRGLALHHDAATHLSGIAARDGGLVLTIYQFEGSYLSLAVTLPEAMIGHLRPGRRLKVEIDAQVSRPLTTFLRLNLDASARRQELHEVVVLDTGARSGRFDLDAAGETPPASAWLDVVFARPRMVEIRLSALRAAFEGE